MNSQSVLEKLEGVKSTGDKKWQALCPAHADKRPSLSITEKDDKILLHCFSGCSLDAILAGAGIDKSDIFADDKNVERKIIAAYDYRDETGSLLFQKLRYEPRDFRIRVPLPGGQWAWKMNGVRRVLYNLPDVISADMVVIAEGEKDCDTLKRLGYVSTCNYDGASKDTQRPKWNADYNQFFKGKIVFIVPDNDPPGKAHAENIYRELKPLAASVRIVRLPSKFKDATEFFQGGGTVKIFTKLCADALDSPDVLSEKEPINLLCCSDIQTSDIEWLWPNRLPLGMLSLIVGDPGIGKSFLSVYLSAVVSTGRDWPDGTPSKAGSVFLFCDEDDFGKVVVPRLKDNGADISKVYCLNELTGPDCLFNITNPEHLQKLETAIKQVDCRLVVFDPITSYLDGVNANSNSEVRAALGGLVRLAQRVNVSIIGISHLNKKAELNAMYRSLGSMGFVAQARAVWGIVKDKTDDTGGTKIFSPIKTNLSVKVKGLSYEIIDGKVVFDSEPIEETIDQSLMASPAMDSAADFLLEVLAGGERVEQTYVMEQAKDRGIKEITVRRAKKKLGVLSTQTTDIDGRKFWFWSMTKGE